MITFLSLFSFAQGTRIMYEYKFVSDLEKKDSANTELMYLDIKKDGSKFYSRQRFVSDSIRDAVIQKQISMGSTNFNFGNNTGKVEYFVTKTYPDFMTVLHTAIGDNRYSVKNEKPMTWKIFPEKKTISKFEVQKATTDFGGRTWTAWFTQEIPFQDGPYKFQGLPGLILEMEDSTGTEVFKFAGSKKFEEIEKVEKKDDIGSTKGGMVIKTFGMASGKEIEVSEDQFRKQWKEFKNDPVKNMRQMLSQGNAKVSLNIDGKIVSDPSEVLRTLERDQKEDIKKNSNKIEPALYP